MNTKTIALPNNKYFSSDIPFGKSTYELRTKYTFKEYVIPVIYDNFKKFDVKNKIKIYDVFDGVNFEENGVRYACFFGFINDKLSFVILVSDKLDASKESFNVLYNNYEKMNLLENKRLKFEPAVTTIFGQRGGGFLNNENLRLYYELQIGQDRNKRKKMISVGYIIDKNVLKVIRSRHGYNLITRSELID